MPDSVANAYPLGFRSGGLMIFVGGRQGISGTDALLLILQSEIFRESRLGRGPI